MLQVLISLRQLALRVTPFLFAAVILADIPITKLIDKSSPLMH